MLSFFFFSFALFFMAAISPGPDAILLPCPVCLDDVPHSSLLRLSCGHALCSACAEAALFTHLRHRDPAGPLHCLVESIAACPTALPPRDEALLAALGARSASQRLRTLVHLWTHPGSVACPREGCPGTGQGTPPPAAVAAAGPGWGGGGGGGAAAAEEGRGALPLALAEEVVCSACALPFCTLHGAAHASGAGECTAWVRQQAGLVEKIASVTVLAETTQPCPRCSRPSTKVYGCNVVRCPQCTQMWCWGCGRASCTCAAPAPVEGHQAQPLEQAQRTTPLGALCILLFGLPLFLIHLALLVLALPWAALCPTQPRVMRLAEGGRITSAPSSQPLRAMLLEALDTSWVRLYSWIHFPGLLQYAQLALRGGDAYTVHLRTALTNEPAWRWVLGMGWRVPSALLPAIEWWHSACRLVPRVPRQQLDAALYSGRTHHALLGFCGFTVFFIAYIEAFYLYTITQWFPSYEIYTPCVPFGTNGTHGYLHNLTLPAFLAAGLNFSVFPCTARGVNFTAEVYSTGSMWLDLWAHNHTLL